jgi:hypothetical protein
MHAVNCVQNIFQLDHFSAKLRYAFTLRFTLSEHLTNQDCENIHFWIHIHSYITKSMGSSPYTHTHKHTHCFYQ